MIEAALDRRTTPARPDLAAAHLAGQVEAERFVEGTPMRVVQAVTGLRGAPSADARLGSELLFGERFTVYEVSGDWAWGQNQADGYVGFVAAGSLGTDAGPEPTHRVTAPRSLIFPTEGIKDPVVAFLSLGTRLAVSDTGAAPDGTPLLRLSGGGFIPAAHAKPIDQIADDWVAVAESLTGTPYLWGGRSALGLDCSALVQLALDAAGIAAPRDSDQQAAALGHQVATHLSEIELRRGDLIFFDGHVVIALDGERILHCNAYHMATASEPLAPALDRIEARAGLRPTAVKRL